MRIDYQRISNEMYESRDEREPRSDKAVMVGWILVIVIPLLLLVVFGTAALGLWQEIKGF